MECFSIVWLISSGHFQVRPFHNIVSKNKGATIIKNRHEKVFFCLVMQVFTYKLSLLDQTVQTLYSLCLCHQPRRKKVYRHKVPKKNSFVYLVRAIAHVFLIFCVSHVNVSFVFVTLVQSPFLSSCKRRCSLLFFCGRKILYYNIKNALDALYVDEFFCFRDLDSHLTILIQIK